MLINTKTVPGVITGISFRGVSKASVGNSITPDSLVKHAEEMAKQSCKFYPGDDMEIIFTLNTGAKLVMRIDPEKFKMHCRGDNIEI